MIDIKSLMRTDEFANQNTDAVKLDVHATGAVIIQVMNNVSSMCWPTVRNVHNPVLYTTNSLMGSQNTPCMALLRCMDSDSLDMFRVAEFQLEVDATFSCAWNTQKNSFSIGSTESSLVIDSETQAISEYHTGRSAVYTQIFEPQVSKH